MNQRLGLEGAVFLDWERGEDLEYHGQICEVNTGGRKRIRGDYNGIGTVTEGWRRGGRIDQRSIQGLFIL
jgi:hypothetical protein